MKLSALIVNQWLHPEWDETIFEPVPPRGKPEPRFYLFSISARRLKRLTGIYRRDPSKPPAEDLGIQRGHMAERSSEILRYLRDGFPLSRIDRRKLVSESEVNPLRMPGWLPTAVVVNILTPDDRRGPKGRAVAGSDLVKVNLTSSGSAAEIVLPDQCDQPNWEPTIHPIEVIDGQHRLWALEESGESDSTEISDLKERLNEIEVPVVAFMGLDRTWQAYLFYTINQLAKRIDISMVFDLYPLLRTEEWLLRFEGPNIYRETRAQDLTILLWSHPASPWKDRISRLGGRERGKVGQAAFVRSLMASFIKRWHGGPRSPIGGIYGSLRGTHELYLNWGREQQAAFLILAWQLLRTEIMSSQDEWTASIIQVADDARTPREIASSRERLFSGQESLLSSDQGVRGFLCVLNDLLWVANDHDAITLTGWEWSRGVKDDDQQAVTDALESFKRQKGDAVAFVKLICEPLSSFDWRLSSVMSPNESNYPTQASYRGSGGYKEIRRNILVHLRTHASAAVSQFTSDVIDALGYEVEE